MSTTIRQLVTDGFRESGLIETGGVPDADEFEEGLRKLQSMYSSLFGHEIGDPLIDINYGKAGLTNTSAKAQDILPEVNATYLPVNCRVLFNLDSAQTIYLHPMPHDGARLSIVDNGNNLATNTITLNANGRQIESSTSVLLNTNSLVRDWFYRADLGQWTRISDLVAEDINPLPREFDDLMSTMLAMRINPRYGAQLDQLTSDILERGQTQLRARYRQINEQSSEAALIRLPSNPYWPNWSIDPKSSFDRGRP